MCEVLDQALYRAFNSSPPPHTIQCRRLDPLTNEKSETEVENGSIQPIHAGMGALIQYQPISKDFALYTLSCWEKINIKWGKM